MLRFAIPAAALVLAAAPAHAASVNVATAGKSQAEVTAQINAAALRLCRAESAGSLLDLHLQAACVPATVRSAQKASKPSELAQISQTSGALRPAAHD